jgi:polynucleotide 5'-hydroxyl-kinase GRC3/NOL9
MCYFLGHLSPNDVPGHYMACLRACYDDFLQYKSSLKQTEKIPLIINTMGWNQGLGLCLLKESIMLFKPNILVQLNHPVEANKNMPLLDKNWLATTDGWPPSFNKTTNNKALVNKNNRYDCNASKSFSSNECLESMDIDVNIDLYSNINYNLVILKSGAPFKSNKFQTKSPQKRFSARDHRNIAILAYFSSLFDPKSFFTPINYLRPYKLSWSKVNLHVNHSRIDYDQLLRVFNASLVGLCQIDPKYVSLLYT